MVKSLSLLVIGLYNIENNLQGKMIEESFNGFDIVNERGLLVYANKAYLKMWGYHHVEEILGTSPANHCEDPDIPLKIISEVEKNGFGIFSFKGKRKDNSLFDVRMQVSIFIDENGEKFYHGFSEDISEAKEYEVKIKKQNKLLSDAEELVKMGSWRWDVAHDKVYWSKGLKKIFHLKEGETPPNWENQHTIFTPESFKVLKEYAELCLNEGIEYSKELEIITLDGKVKTCIVKGRPSLNSNGNITGLWGSLFDISEQKEVEARLEEANLFKTKLFSVIGHDLKSPINNILSIMELINEDFVYSNSNEVKDFLPILKSSAESAKLLLDSLLGWSMAKLDYSIVNPEHISLSNLFAEVKSELKQSAILKQINIDIADCKNLSVYADKNLLKTVLRNLISNAIKFSNKNCSVNIKASIEKSSVLISVSDNGVGISEDLAKSLFSDDTIQSTAGTNNEKGTGLGLKVCKEFVRLQGGEIWAESKLNVGTTIFFTVPIKN